MEGDNSEQKFTGQIESYFKIPDKSMTFIKLSNGNLTKEVFNGNNGWIYNSVKGTRNATPQQIDSQRRGSALFYGEINTFKGFYSKFTVTGSERLDDKEVIILEAITLDNQAEKYYFDTTTKLLIRVDCSQSSVATQKGVSFSTEIYFEDYVNLDGFKMPLTSRQQAAGWSYIIKYDVAGLKLAFA